MQCIHSDRFNRGRGPVIVETQPTTTVEHCRLARKFARDFDISLECSAVEWLVDDPERDDPFEKAYAPWPLRLYLIRDGKVEWIAQSKDCSFDLAVGELMALLKLYE